MAMINEKLQNLKESLNCLNKAFECDPHNQKVQILKQRLEQIIIGVNSGLINPNKLKTPVSRPKSRNGTKGQVFMDN